jgi:hypothetical protein
MIPSTYPCGSCTPPSCPHAEYPLNRKLPLTGSTANAPLNQSAVCPRAFTKISSSALSSFLADRNANYSFMPHEVLIVISKHASQSRRLELIL